MLLQLLGSPTIRTLVMRELFLKIAEIAHVFEMHLHICREDHLDQETAHFRVQVSAIPIAAKNLRICRAMECLEHRIIVVELS